MKRIKTKHAHKWFKVINVYMTCMNTIINIELWISLDSIINEFWGNVVAYIDTMLYKI